MKVKASSLEADVLTETYGNKLSETVALPRTFIIDLSDVIATSLRDDLNNVMKSHCQHWSFVLVFRDVPKHSVPNSRGVRTRPLSAKSFNVVRSDFELICECFGTDSLVLIFSFFSVVNFLFGSLGRPAGF